MRCGILPRFLHLQFSGTITNIAKKTATQQANAHHVAPILAADYVFTLEATRRPATNAPPPHRPPQSINTRPLPTQSHSRRMGQYPKSLNRPIISLLALMEENRNMVVRIPRVSFASLFYIPSISPAATVPSSANRLRAQVRYANQSPNGIRSNLHRDSPFGK